ncbi:hypothetical protein C7212DRAFT_314147 [Tuber magnatum]|uniref:Uncharacterized protein n=1 Tax=Tuber magnatum TaxID=42249 RepID=A0A317SVH9_9PEZI|nr:hypothetical protein C7212DRAFT_314147 [Tuber magnatum]
MKFSSVLLFATSIVSALAAPAASRSRPFNLKTAGSSNNELNNFRVKNFGNHASFGAGEQDVRAYFADDGSRRLIVNGLDGTEDYAFLIPDTPGSPVSNFVFADTAVGGSRSTEWGIIDGKLVYESKDRFYAFPTTDGWEIRWVNEGAITTADSFPIDLAVEFI